MERSMDERSVTIKTPGNMSDAEDRMMGEERIEVQVIPQDDNWGDNTTAITGRIIGFEVYLIKFNSFSW